MIKEITASLYADLPTETLYHYTTFRGFLGIIQHQSLWASDIRYMNDSAELRHTANLVHKEVARRLAGDHPRPALLTRFLGWIDHRITNGHMLFGASFRTHGNLLSQWRGYSTPGKGVSIGFCPRHLVDNAERQNFQIGRCLYDPQEQADLIAKVVDAIENLAENYPTDAEVGDRIFEQIESDLLRIAAVLKHPSFQEEEEWRLVSPVVTNFLEAPVSFREGTSMLVPYLSFDLTPEDRSHFELAHVYLGPTSYVELSMNSVSMTLAKADIHVRQGVEYCQIPYRQK